MVSYDSPVMKAWLMGVALTEARAGGTVLIAMQPPANAGPQVQPPTPPALRLIQGGRS